MSKQGHKGAFSIRKDALEYLLEDIDSMFEYADKKSGKLPRLLIGTGMGAMLAELYSVRSDEISAIVLIGVLQPPGSIPYLITAANNFIRTNTYDAPFEAMYTLIVQPLKMPGIAPGNQFYWLSTDEYAVNEYASDENCGFPLTASGYMELFKGFQLLEDAKKGIEAVPNIPILILSGGSDQLGQCGKAAHEHADRLERSKHSQVKLQIYDDCCHDVLHDKCCEITVEDIIKFLDESI